MTKEQAIDQCRKINELVKRGIGGEQQAAKNRLAIIMDKYDIEPHEIEGDKIEEFSIICTEEQRKFARQVIASVIGKKAKVYKYRKRYYFNATLAQSIDIIDRWNHYKKLWVNELDLFYSAFIQKHKLYAKDLGDNEDDDKPLTPEEKERLYKMFKMMEGMEYSNYRKKIV